MSAVLVLAGVPLIVLLAVERQETFQLPKGHTCLTHLQEIAPAKEAIRKDGRHRLDDRWHGDQTGRWTYRLNPELATWLNRKHGEVMKTRELDGRRAILKYCTIKLNFFIFINEKMFFCNYKDYSKIYT